MSLAFVLILAALAGAQSTTVLSTGKLGDALVTTNNPSGISYIATLPNNTKSDIRGYVKATTGSNGTGVEFEISLSGFPLASLGPFLYHVHDQPVPASGNCTATLAHLDPFVRGEKPPCDPNSPATCQVGDLSGKYGKISSDPFIASYHDLYLSTKQGLGSYFGNRSIVIHELNTTRLTCANFVVVDTAAQRPDNNVTEPAGGASQTTAYVGPSISPSFPVSFTGVGTSVGANLNALFGVVLIAFCLMW